MKKAFYLFISVLLVLFSFNKVNDSRAIKRSNEQTNKEEIILIYSSSDFYTFSRQESQGTYTFKFSSTFKISTKRRYIVALRTNHSNIDFNALIDLELFGFDKSLNLNSGEDVFNYISNNGYQYEQNLAPYTNLTTDEGGYLTYYLSMLDYGNTNNYSEMIISIAQKGLNNNLSFFIQDIYVYDITYITTQGETWYNYQSGAVDPSAIQEAYDKGYSDAVKSGTGLNWLQSAFNMIANILNIEVLPNIKIAYLVAIPLLIELILFVLRFIK